MNGKNFIKKSSNHHGGPYEHNFDLIVIEEITVKVTKDRLLKDPNKVIPRDHSYGKGFN